MRWYPGSGRAATSTISPLALIASQFIVQSPVPRFSRQHIRAYWRRERLNVAGFVESYHRPGCP